MLHRSRRALAAIPKIAVLFLVLIAPVLAGMDEGVRAYARGDVATAIAEWRSAADEGNVAAAYLLGNLYATGTGVPKENAEAFKYYLQAAEGGHIDAQTAVGTYYRTGDRDAEIERDIQKALSWFEKAALQKNARAQYFLGEIYTLGDGVQRNRYKGLRWYLLAANKHYAPALAQLGEIYFYGQPVAEDRAQGFMYMLLALENAEPVDKASITERYNDISVKVTPEERAEAERRADSWRVEHAS